MGLGNPGREHEGQRHNAGFMAVEALRWAEGLPEPKAKFEGLFARGELAGHAFALLQPQTYMNRSGDSVQPAAAFLKLEPSDLVVVHDELDLPFGQVRLKVGGGHAGHNGVRSVIERLGSPGFVRVRLGVGRPSPAFQGAVADWVLSRFDPVETAALPEVLDRAAQAVRLVVTQGIQAAMKAVSTPRL